MLVPEQGIYKPGKDLLTSVNNREREREQEQSRQKTQLQPRTNRVNLPSSLIISTQRVSLKMSPIQVAATSVLLLASVYLSVGAHIPTRRAATEPQDITNRTGSEAIVARFLVGEYFKYKFNNKDLNVTTTCSKLEYNLSLTCPKDVPGCNSMVNVSTNLQHLRPIFSHVVGLIYENSTDNTQMLWLDLLEMIYYRLSKQTQRYLEAENHSGNTSDIVGTIAKLQQEHTNIKIAEAALCHLRDIALDIIFTVGIENSQLRPSRLCKSVQDFCTS